jgi:hypothetical protein
MLRALASLSSKIHLDPKGVFQQAEYLSQELAAAMVELLGSTT